MSDDHATHTDPTAHFACKECQAVHAADLDAQVHERLPELRRQRRLDEAEVPSTAAPIADHEHTEECVNVADEYEKAVKAHGRAQDRLRSTHDRLKEVREHWHRLHPK